MYEALSIELVKDYVPDSWIALVQVKSQYYKATAHQLVGAGLVTTIDGRHHLSPKTVETLSFMYSDDQTSETSPPSGKPKVSTIIDIRVPANDNEQLQLGNAHSPSQQLLLLLSNNSVIYG